MNKVLAFWQQRNNNKKKIQTQTSQQQNQVSNVQVFYKLFANRRIRNQQKNRLNIQQCSFAGFKTENNE